MISRVEPQAERRMTARTMTVQDRVPLHEQTWLRIALPVTLFLLVRQSLPPGKHSVRAVSPSGTVRNVSITIESGKVAPTRRIEW